MTNNSTNQSQTNPLDGKVAVITGASSGIGEATALRLALSGMKLVLGARRTEKLEALQAAIEARGGTALTLRTDVTQESQVRALVQLALDRFGRVDVMVNNAGIMPLSNMGNLRVSEWNQTIDVNIKGVLYGIAAALPGFIQQKSGHFVNIASAGGRRVYPGCAVYCATKFAVRALSEGLRQDLPADKKIRVTVIEPGAVKTELPQSIQDPEQRQRLKGFSEAITFLEASDVADSIHYAVSQPERVNVDEILLLPREQAH